MDLSARTTVLMYTGDDWTPIPEVVLSSYVGKQVRLMLIHLDHSVVYKLGSVNVARLGTLYLHWDVCTCDLCKIDHSTCKRKPPGVI